MSSLADYFWVRRAVKIAPRLVKVNDPRDDIWAMPYVGLAVEEYRIGDQVNGVRVNLSGGNSLCVPPTWIVPGDLGNVALLRPCP